jgi:hypothetical protein
MSTRSKKREKTKFTEVKTPEQSTENKDKASSSALHPPKKEESNKPPPIVITGVENHENFTSIIKQAYLLTPWPLVRA